MEYLSIGELWTITMSNSIMSDPVRHKINFSVTGQEYDEIKRKCVQTNNTENKTRSIHEFCRKVLFEVLGLPARED